MKQLSSLIWILMILLLLSCGNEGKEEPIIGGGYPDVSVYPSEINIGIQSCDTIAHMQPQSTGWTVKAILEVCGKDTTAYNFKDVTLPDEKGSFEVKQSWYQLNYTANGELAISISPNTEKERKSFILLEFVTGSTTTLSIHQKGLD